MDHNRILFSVVSIILLVIKGIATELYSENNLEEDKYFPGFLTLGQKYSIALGSTVILPCKINETEKSNEYVLAWIRNRAVLLAGETKVTTNPRVRLMPSNGFATGYNLEIKDVKLSDAGEYICQMGAMIPKEVIHTLEVLTPPKIIDVSHTGRVDISKSAQIRLECRAIGNPPPKIIWSRKNNVLPNGEANITGEVFEMQQASRHTAGHYRCTADNRVGQTDTREINVNVLYAPEIEVERSLIHTGVGYEAILTCIVHAEPQPHVIWYKDTTQLGTTEQHSQQNRGNKFSLIIRNVTYSDFGNYTCQASNSLGRERGGLTLTGYPTVCSFSTSQLGPYKDQYNISWTVTSFSPIREYRLFYRKQSIYNPYPLDENLETHFANHPFTHSNAPLNDQWENVVIPEILDEYGQHVHFSFNHHMPHNPLHARSFLIRNLVPATNYEAKVQARNDHGWNKLSTTFHFTTKSDGVDNAIHPEVYHGAELRDKSIFSNTSNSVSFTFTIFTLIVPTSLILLQYFT